MVYNKLIKYLNNNLFGDFSNELFLDENKLTDEQRLYIYSLAIKDIKYINILIDYSSFIALFDKNTILNIINSSVDEYILKLFDKCDKCVLNRYFCKIFDLKNKTKIINTIIDNKLVDINYIDKYGRSFLFYAIKNYPGIALKLCDILEVDLSSRDLFNKSLLSSTKDNNIITKILQQSNIFKKQNLNITRFKFDDIFYFENCNYNKGTYGKVFPIIKKSEKKIKMVKYFYDNKGSFNCDITTEIFLLLRINKTYNNPLTSIIDGLLYEDEKLYLVFEPFDLTLGGYFNLIRKNKEYPIIKSIFNSLYQIHSLGIIHGDIKPSNIMISNNQCYLIDYGLSQNILYSTNNWIFSGYVTTPNVSAPESSNLTFNFIGYETKKDRISYSVDIFSLGIAILQCILNTNYKYIYYKEQLYYTDNFSLTGNVNYRLINNNNIPIYLLKMINYNQNERPTLKNLLEIQTINNLRPTSEYKLNFINDTQFILVKNITHYSIDDIIYKRYELEYFDEIYESYKNDIFKINKNVDSLFLKSIDQLLKYLYTHNFCFDSLINSIELFLSGNCDFLSLIYTLYSNIGNVGSKLFVDKYNEYYNNLVISSLEKNITLKPVMIHIQYYIIKLSYIVDELELSQIEWFLIKNIFMFFISNKFEITMSNLCQILLIRYFKSINVDFLDYTLIDKYHIDENIYSQYENIKNFI